MGCSYEKFCKKPFILLFCSNYLETTSIFLLFENFSCQLPTCVLFHQFQSVLTFSPLEFALLLQNSPRKSLSNKHETQMQKLQDNLVFFLAIKTDLLFMIYIITFSFCFKFTWTRGILKNFYKILEFPKTIF